MDLANLGGIATCGVMTPQEKVTKLMAERGLSQTDLAASAGVAKQRINEFVAGKWTPKPYQYLLLARGLGVDLDYLIDDEQDEPRRREVTEDEQIILRVVRALGLSADEVVRRLEIAARVAGGFPDAKEDPPRRVGITRRGTGEESDARGGRKSS